MNDVTVHVGVARLTLHFPGARTLKDRRKDLVSLRDRVRHRFEVTWNSIDLGDDPRRAVVALTTSGGDPREVRSVLDQVVHHVESSGRAVLGLLDVDVFPWHPPEERWSFDEDDDNG